MDKVEEVKKILDQRYGKAEMPDKSHDYNMTTAKVVARLFEHKPDLTDEQRTGIKEGIKAVKEGRVRPWEDIRAELKPDKIEWCPQHGYPLPCAKCGMPKPDKARW